MENFHSGDGGNARTKNFPEGSPPGGVFRIPTYPLRAGQFGALESMADVVLRNTQQQLCASNNKKQCGDLDLFDSTNHERRPQRQLLIVFGKPRAQSRHRGTR